MGMQGPLAAQALGRSPYDDVVECDEDHDDKLDVNESGQQYDHRGRPINPETKRINRDIIRSHNEVMLVIGVAEQENPTSNPEAESDKRHATYEDDVGISLAFSALRCVDAAGAFGLDGFRQRVLLTGPAIDQSTDALGAQLMMCHLYVRSTGKCLATQAQ
ncbi:hypothetical protein IL306_003047 [Fusarium sp. DS 682]|nr:hypothetical protein IL306_003047 [Fusarium sp. DS 682]